MHIVYQDPELNVSVVDFCGVFAPVFNDGEHQKFVAIEGKPQTFNTKEKAIEAVKSYGSVSLVEGERYAVVTI